MLSVACHWPLHRCKVRAKSDFFWELSSCCSKRLQGVPGAPPPPPPPPRGASLPLWEWEPAKDLKMTPRQKPVVSFRNRKLKVEEFQEKSWQKPGGKHLGPHQETGAPSKLHHIQRNHMVQRWPSQTLAWGGGLWLDAYWQLLWPTGLWIPAWQAGSLASQPLVGPPGREGSPGGNQSPPAPLHHCLH